MLLLNLIKQKRYGKLLGLFVLFAISVYAAIDASVTVNEKSVMVAVMGGMWNEGMSLYRKGLSKKMERAVWLKSKWARFTGIMDVDNFKKAGSYGGTTSLSLSGNLIDVRKEFEREGGGEMEIPVMQPLTNPPTFGTKPMRGREEKRKYYIKKIAINQVRHAVEIQDNKMSKQMLKKPEVQMALMERGQKDLQDYFSRWQAMQPYFALLEGYSDNLTDSENGAGKILKSNPNFYVAGSGKVTFSHTPSTFETNVGTALSGLADTASDYFGSQTIRNAVYLARQLKFAPIVVNGLEVFPMFITDAQARQLRNDPEWINAQKEAANRGDKNDIFTGVVERIYEGALIIVDSTIPSISVTGGVPVYRASNYMANPRSIGNIKPAIICGQNAIVGGYGSELGYENETADYGQFLGDEASMICGFERSDIYDVDNFDGNGANRFKENASSAVIATYSPDEVTWA